MCAVMHVEIVECLEQTAMHRHVLYTVDVEVTVGRPERISVTKRMR